MCAAAAEAEGEARDETSIEERGERRRAAEKKVGANHETRDAQPRQQARRDARSGRSERRERERRT